MPYEGQYNRKTDKVYSAMTGGWDNPMPGYNVEDDWKRPKMRRRKKQYKRARSFRRKKRGGLFSLTVRKGRKVWRMVRKFKSKASRDRAKRGLRSVGWR
jgi:hypothetical protein